MRKKAFRPQVWCVLLLVALSVACGKDNSSFATNPSVDDLLDQGKEQLALNEGLAAAEAFAQAQVLVPANTDAAYGLLLADVMQFPNFIDDIVEQINGLNFQEELTSGEGAATSGPSFAPASSGGSFDSDFTDPIHAYLREKLVPAMEQGEVQYAALTSQADLAFETPVFDLSINGSTLLSFGGVFDQTDLHFFGALNSLLDAALHLLLALDLRFDPTVLQLPKSDPDATLVETLNMIFDLLSGLLTSEDYPTFLYLVENTGVADMQAAGIDMGNTFTRFALAFESLRRETGNQADAQLGYHDANGNDRYDPAEETLFIGSTVELDPALAVEIAELCAILPAVFWEGSAYDVDPTRVDTLRLSDLDGLLEVLNVLPIDLGPLTIDGLPTWIEINVGQVFSDPEPDEVRRLLVLVVNLWQVLFPT